MKSASKWPVRIGLALAATVYLVYSSFGIAAPFFWGHHGYHGATYLLRARTSLRLHMLAPATWTGYDPPPWNAYYFHHPIGYHHILTVLMPVFGDHEWLARAVAAIGGLFTLWALYALVKKAWSRELGLAAVVIYIAMPVVTSFSILSDPMLLAMACTLWGLWAYLELIERPSRRALVHAAFAYGLSGLIMWEAFFIAPFIALHAIAYSQTRRGQPLTKWLWAHIFTIGATCIATMAFHIWFTHHTGAWDEFLESYRIRHTPPSGPYVIDRHTQWVELLYGRTPLVVGAIWFVVWLARLTQHRGRLRDLLPLTFLYVNTLYIYMFAEGSSVHLYRVFFYSGFFTLAAVDLMSDAARAAAHLWHPRWAAPVAAICALVVYLGFEVPHAWANLLESRVNMGTHGESYPGTEWDKYLFAKQANLVTSPDERVIVHYGHLGARKEMWYYLDRSFDEITTLGGLDKYKATFNKSVLILDFLKLGASEKPIYEALIRQHPVTFYGHYALIDLRNPTPGATGYAFVPGPMSATYRWWVSRRYPPLHLERMAYLPGFCHATTLGVPVATDEPLPPQPEPSLRTCYHNLLADRKDSVGAQKMADTILRDLKPIALGEQATLYVGPSAGRLRLVLAPKVNGGGPLSYKMGDRPMASALPAAWTSGHLYSDELPLPVRPMPFRLLAPCQVVPCAAGAKESTVELGTFTK